MGNTSENIEDIPLGKKDNPLDGNAIPLDKKGNHLDNTIPIENKDILLDEKADSPDAKNSRHNRKSYGSARNDGAEAVKNRILDICSEAKNIVEIMNELGYKDKKTIRKYLAPLVKQGRIAMTIPEKPTSRNQKYITIK